ncbi:hypothetical protein DFH09DRAFT_1323223 [Mycena vulgaris]|nr:hypothetical protein DFH09DRAFT_1323223 [Mycena vulgaris]
MSTTKMSLYGQFMQAFYLRSAPFDANLMFSSFEGTHLGSPGGVYSAQWSLGQPRDAPDDSDPASPITNNIIAEKELPQPSLYVAPLESGIVHARALTIDLPLVEAVEEISCEYNQPHNLFLQYIQFSLGGIPNPESAGSISPRAVYRTWRGNVELAGQPFWVKYHKTGCAVRVVTYDFAVGRAALLSYIPENVSISNQLVDWANKAGRILSSTASILTDAIFQFHSAPFELEHAHLRYLHDDTAEDSNADPDGELSAENKEILRRHLEGQEF